MPQSLSPRIEMAAARPLTISCGALLLLARRLGLASIEQEAEALENGLLRRALLLVVDGIATEEVRRQLQIEIMAEEDRAEADARLNRRADMRQHWNISSDQGADEQSLAQFA